jgi:two-component system chemotaxis response regulator CheB
MWSEGETVGETKKVFIAAGNAVELEALSGIIKNAHDFSLAGTAKDRDDLVKRIISSTPHAIVLDLDTFGPEPLGAIRDIMRLAPAPIILITAKKDMAATAFEGIAAGALTVIKKPTVYDLKANPAAGDALLKAIKTYSAIQVIRHVHGGLEDMERGNGRNGNDKNRIVAIASSTGGPQALKRVLCELPASFPAGIVIAQHITQGFADGLVSWLGGLCAIKIKEPSDGEIIRPGIAYIAPDGFHMTVERGGKIALDNAAPLKGHRPSCDKLLKSVAKVYGDRAVGVILSGMGSDGAEGLKQIREAGGMTIAQDEKSCVVFGMPKVAYEIGAVSRTTSLDRIGWEILREFR